MHFFCSQVEILLFHPTAILGTVFVYASYMHTIYLFTAVYVAYKHLKTGNVPMNQFTSKFLTKKIITKSYVSLPLNDQMKIIKAKEKDKLPVREIIM